MKAKVAESILKLSEMMMAVKAAQQDGDGSGNLTEREYLILSLLSKNGRMRVSEIADSIPNVSYSTISVDITGLWRNKLVTKTIDPSNQRSTIVDLTEQGRRTLEHYEAQRQERFEKLYEALGTTPEEEQMILRITNRAIEYFEKHFGMVGRKVLSGNSRS